MKTLPLVLFLAALSPGLPGTSSAAADRARSGSESRLDEQAYREFVRLDVHGRKAFLNDRFPTKKLRNEFKRGCKVWVQSFKSRPSLCEAFGFPESGPGLHESYSGASGLTQGDFEDGLRALGVEREFRAEHSSWFQAEAERARANERAQGLIGEIHRAFTQVEQGLAEAAGVTFVSSRYPSARNLANQLLRASAQIDEIGAAWHAHLDEHPDCPAANWTGFLEPFLESEDGVSPEDPELVAGLRDAAWAAGHLEIGFGLASLVCELDGGRRIHENGTSRLTEFRMGTELGPPWTGALQNGALDEFLEREDTREEALGLLALTRLTSSLVMAASAPPVDPSIDPAIMLSIRRDHVQKSQDLRQQGHDAVVALEALGPRSARALEVLGLYGLFEKRPGPALESITLALEQAERDDVTLRYAGKLLPVAHALSRGKDGLAGVLPTAYRGGPERDLFVLLADAWQCAPAVLAVLDPSDSEGWCASLALRRLRIGDAERAREQLVLLEESGVELAPRARMVQAWVLLACGEEPAALEAASAALLASRGADDILWRSARLVHARAERLNPLRPASAAGALAALDDWEKAIGSRPVGALAERAFLHAAVGEVDRAAPLLRDLMERDPSLARDTWSDLVAFDRENAEAAAARLELRIDPTDSREELRRAATRMGLDDIHVGRGLDGLRVELEDESRRRTADRGERLLREAMLAPVDAADPEAKTGLLDSGERQLFDAEGLLLSPLPITLRDGSTRTLQELSELPMVVYVSGEAGPAMSALARSVEALNEAARMGCGTMFLYHGSAEGLDRHLGTVDLDPQILVGRLSEVTPRGWGKFLSYPSVFLVDDSGAILISGHPTTSFGRVFTELRRSGR